MKLVKSEKLFQNAKRVIPGGVNSPVRSFSSVGGTPPFISRAEGPFLWDVDGNRYIDFVGSWGPMILGHSHPAIIESLQKVVVDGTSFGASTDKEIILAELIIDRVPGCEMIRLVNSGTEACMSALRLARGITGKDKVIKFEGCYHGHSDSFLISSGSGGLTVGIPDSPGVTSGTANDTLLAQFNKIETVKSIFESNKNKIAAIIVEPVNGNTGCIPPYSNFLFELKNLCVKNDALLIFDEVITGFRISRGGASEYYKVKPDLYTFGKIIGGGLPIGAFGGKKEYMEYIAPIGSIYQAGTLSGNPIAVTAGIETLKHLDIDAYKKLDQLSLYFQNQVTNIIDTPDFDILLNMVGSMFSIFFDSGPIINTNNVQKCNLNAFKYYFNFMLQSGVYISPSQFEVGFISLAHTEDLIDKFVEEVKNIFNHRSFKLILGGT